MVLSNDSTTTSIRTHDEVLDPQQFYISPPALSLCYSAVDIDNFDIRVTAGAIPVSVVPPAAAPVAASTPPAAPPVVPAAVR